MKRAILVLSIIFSIFSSISATEDLFSLSIGPQSGLVFYGDKSLKSNIKSLDGSHIIVGALAEFNINPYKQVTFFASADTLCEMVREGKDHSNLFHVDFPFGIKIYPGIGGLCGGLAYTFGFRYDNIEIKDKISHKGYTAWGNGCKFMIEYNFAHDHNSRFLPTLGASWKYIPRGNNATDNIISAYVLINL